MHVTERDSLMTILAMTYMAHNNTFHKSNVIGARDIEFALSELESVLITLGEGYYRIKDVSIIEKWFELKKDNRTIEYLELINNTYNWNNGSYNKIMKQCAKYEGIHDVYRHYRGLHCNTLLFDHDKKLIHIIKKERHLE